MATHKKQRGIVNVGKFSKGNVVPSLSAVRFLEARWSSVDMIQTVWRMNRRYSGRENVYGGIMASNCPVSECAANGAVNLDLRH